MLRTITIGSSLQVQGVLVRCLPDGRITVRVDGKLFTGHPIPTYRAA
ncbi:MAG: hypothetical protein ACLGIE_16635 [Alphaproteobacteria bacterium]